MVDRKIRMRVITIMRNAVRDQIKSLQVGRDVHVHHDGLTFREIVEHFLIEEGITFEEVDDCHSKGSKQDQSQLKKRWQLYHKQMATLARVDKEEHKRIHGKHG